MATEYRIPVTIELQEQKNNDPIQKSANLAQNAIPKEEDISASAGAIASIQSVHRIMMVGNKLLSASGNNQYSSVIRTTGKAMSVAVTALSGNYAMAAVQAILEITEAAMRQLQKIEQETQESNAANFNNIKLGKTILKGGNVSASKDLFGRITYNVN